MVSPPEDGVDIAKSVVSQLPVGVLEACALGGVALAPTAGPADAEADCPAMEIIPRHSAINSAARVRTPPPPPSLRLLQ